MSIIFYDYSRNGINTFVPERGEFRTFFYLWIEKRNYTITVNIATRCVLWRCVSKVDQFNIFKFLCDACHLAIYSCTRKHVIHTKHEFSPSSRATRTWRERITKITDVWSRRRRFLIISDAIIRHTVNCIVLIKTHVALI